MAKYSEFWSLNVNRVRPHIPSLATPPPSPHNLVQNKHVLHCCRLLYLRAVQRVLKTHWDSRRLDWTRLGRCEHPLTLESDWTGLDSTRLCWCVGTLTVPYASKARTSLTMASSCSINISRSPTVDMYQATQFGASQN